MAAGNTLLPGCNSARHRPGEAEPEIYFPTPHIVQDGPNGAPVAAYREQTVEIALGGPRGPSQTETLAP